MGTTGKNSRDAPGQAGQHRLPEPFCNWFAARGWIPRDHQLAMLAAARARRSALLIAPTGGGKTLAGFLPSLIDLAALPRDDLHTLYISPLKALAVDIARNLEQPVADMKLDISLETRTGDTPASKRQRQRRLPPNILITTPEQVALLIAHGGAGRLFSTLNRIVIDELHALTGSKRGVLLSLGLARLRELAPAARLAGLSATVAQPKALSDWLDNGGDTQVITGVSGAEPNITILRSKERIPWSGHSARYALADIYRAIRSVNMALVFVNTRSQAEFMFRELWSANEDGLPIALHHGSLDAGQRRKIEAAMAAGRLRAVVCTSTLDLGIDWGDVDLVINIGAPKGSSRILQRIGRANHRLEESSRALLVPANLFEVLECEAARAAVVEGLQDTSAPMEQKLDVLCQHILAMACAGPFQPDALFDEVRRAWPYRNLTRAEFDACVDFTATGGYALRVYERHAKLRARADGSLGLAHPRLAQRYRLNAGTIVQEEMVKVRLVSKRARVFVSENPLPARSPARPPTTGYPMGGRAGERAGNGFSSKDSRKPLMGRGGKVLGEIEEWFIEQLSPGDTFVFAGQILSFQALDELNALVSRSTSENPRIPSYYGGKFPLSTYLAGRVRAMLADPNQQQHLPAQVRDWLAMQRKKSILPRGGQLLVETFTRGARHYLVCYPFEGRLTHQTLGMLLTRRLERAGAKPLGFVANEYALSIWGLSDLTLWITRGRLELARLFDEDMLGDDLDAWLAESNLMKRTFRTCAIIAGLIERRGIKNAKTGRQLTVSCDLIYDVLRSHEPDHVLLRAAASDAGDGLIDVHRLGQLLARVRGNIVHRGLEAVSPLAVPVLLEIGREPVYGEGDDALLAEAASGLEDDAFGAP